MHLAGTHPRHILGFQDTAFGNHQTVSGNPGQQTERRFQRSFKRAQVAVVDADQRRFQLQRGFQFCTIMHFDQH